MAQSDGQACQPGRGTIADVLWDAGRLARLKAADLMDTPPDEEFDRLSRLASKTLHAPVALVTLVTGDRQFFKSCLGLPEPWNAWRQTPLSHSFCQHVVASCKPLVITDARSDARVSTNLAIQDLGVIAYLGIPLTTPDGWCLGSFCVIDHEPRSWTEEEIWVVQTLAYSVMSEIELRQHRRHLQGMVHERTAQLNAELTRSRELQSQLHDALAAANAANETKRRFIAGLSHELRTPLTPVLLSASMGATDETLPQDARDMFEMIRIQVQREATLIDELLRAAELGHTHLAPNMQKLDLHRLLRRLSESHLSEIKRKSLLIEHDFRASHPTVLADEKRLLHAFSNIMGNCIRFSPTHARITLRTTQAQDPNPTVCTQFIDEGIGLAPEELSHVFDPFWQSPAATEQGGAGLGLTIAKSLIELHGGTLTASSDGPVRGATFTICLPVR